MRFASPRAADVAPARCLTVTFFDRDRSVYLYPQRGHLTPSGQRIAPRNFRHCSSVPNCRSNSEMVCIMVYLKCINTVYSETLMSANSTISARKSRLLPIIEIPPQSLHNREADREEQSPYPTLSRRSHRIQSLSLRTAPLRRLLPPPSTRRGPRQIPEALAEHGNAGATSKTK